MVCYCKQGKWHLKDTCVHFLFGRPHFSIYASFEEAHQEKGRPAGLSPRTSSQTCQDRGKHSQ